MDCAIYRHVMEQIKKSCCLSHDVFPSHNLVSQDTLLKFSKDWNNVDKSEIEDSQFLSSFPCYRQFDYEVQTTLAFHCGSGMVDEAAGLVKRKSNWERQLKNLRIHDIQKALCHIKDLTKKELKKPSRQVCRLIDHFHKDPEPMFEGSYNWLYTGGSVLGVEHCNQVTLFAADYSCKKSLINVLKLNKSLDEVEWKSHIRLKRNSPILQISGKAAGENLIVIVRQKNNASLYRLSINEALSVPEKLWRKKSSGFKLLTYVDVNPDCREVLVSDTNHDVHVFDVEMRKKIFGYSAKKWKLYDPEGEHWNQVFFGDSGLYLALRNGFCVVDSRDYGSKAQLTFTPPSAVNSCEEICSVTKSACDSNYLYLGTTHNVLQLDVRTGKPVQRWTHLMRNPPQFISSAKNGEEEFIVLQSHQTDETVGITNERLDDEGGGTFLSRSLPCYLKGVKESLKLARFNGLCLSPSVAKRFDFAVTGVQCCQSGKRDIRLFTGNSAGDIFLSKITKSGADLNGENGNADTEQVLRTMKVYESHCGGFVPETTFPRSVELLDLKNVLTKLKNSKLKKEKYKKPEIYWKNHEMFAPESLGFYKDVLAQKILKVWDQESDSELDTTASADAKVREWMEKI